MPSPPTIRSWGVSAGLHAALILLAGLLYEAAPVHSASEGAVRPVEIVVREVAAGGSRSFLDSAGGAAAPRSAAPAVAHMAFRPPAVDLSAGLPRGDLPNGASNAVGAAASGLAGVGLVPGAGDLTGGAGRGRVAGDPLKLADEDARPAARPGPVGEPAEISMFGRRTKAHRFVFVIDRSNSMGAGLHYILEAAKSQLIQALGEMGENHEFQIVFYNDRPSVFRGGGLAVANEANKRAAREFISGMTAAGSTQHDLAMYAAVKMQPQVIYLLTDAHPPQLSRLELDIIKRQNGGAFVIHTIEFGAGKPFEEDNFLKRLATENGGLHRYIDVTQPLDRK